MQASFLVTSLLPASPGGSSAGMNASQGAASIGNFASTPTGAGSDTQPSFSSLLDRASQGEAATPNRPAAAASSARPSGPQEARTATTVPKETKVEVGEETERPDAASAAPEEGGDEKTVEDAASGQHGVAPEVAQLLNQLMTGTARAPTDRTTAPLQPSQGAKGQAEALGAATKSTPKDLAKTSEPSTGEALSAAAALRKSMPRSGEADPAMATDSTKAPGASPPGESLRVEPPNTSKAVEPRPQSTQTALPQIVGNLMAPGAGAAGFSTVMNTSTTPTTAESAIPHGIHQAEFVPAFSARIATMVRDGVEQARLHLNPVEMGPVALKLSLDGQQVRVDMTAELAATRQVLEQSMPALAGALRDAGFTLAGGGVFQPGDEASGRPRNSPGGSEAGTGQAGQEGSGAWSSASGQPSDGRRPQGDAPGTMTRTVAGPGTDIMGDLPDDMTNMQVQTGADGTVRWPAGTRLVDMFA